MRTFNIGRTQLILLLWGEKVLTFGAWAYDKPVYVASHSDLLIPLELDDKVFQTQGSPKLMLESLNDKGLRNLYVDGGSLIQSFLRDGLIDDFIVTTVPVLIGEGISLFGYLPKKIELKFVSSEVILNQLVKTHYRLTSSKKLA